MGLIGIISNSLGAVYASLGVRAEICACSISGALDVLASSNTQGKTIVMPDVSYDVKPFASKIFMRRTIQV